MKRDKKLSNRECEWMVYTATLKLLKIKDSEELQALFKSGCTFGFALNHPIQFETWEEAFRCYKATRDE